MELNWTKTKLQYLFKLIPTACDCTAPAMIYYYDSVASIILCEFVECQCLALCRNKFSQFEFHSLLLETFFFAGLNLVKFLYVVFHVKYFAITIQGCCGFSLYLLE